MEKLRSKLDFPWLKQFSVFLRISVNVITSFNNLHAVNMWIRGFLVYVYPLIIRLFPYNVDVSLLFSVSHVRGTRFLTAVSNERNRIAVPYFPRRLTRLQRNAIAIK